MQKHLQKIIGATAIVIVVLVFVLWSTHWETPGKDPTSIAGDLPTQFSPTGGTTDKTTILKPRVSIGDSAQSTPLNANAVENADWFSEFIDQLQREVRSESFHDLAYKILENHLGWISKEEWESKHGRILAFIKDSAQSDRVRGTCILAFARLFPTEAAFQLLPLVQDDRNAIELRIATVQGLAWIDGKREIDIEIQTILQPFEKAGKVYPLKIGAEILHPQVKEVLLAAVTNPARAPNESEQHLPFFEVWPDFLLRNIAALSLGGSMADDQEILNSFEHLLFSKEPEAQIVRDSLVYLFRKNPDSTVQKTTLRYFNESESDPNNRAGLLLDLLMRGALPIDKKLVDKLHSSEVSKMEKEAIFIGLAKQIENGEDKAQPELAYLLYEECVNQDEFLRASAFRALSNSSQRDLVNLAMNQMLLEDPRPNNRAHVCVRYRPGNDFEKARFVEALEASFRKWTDDTTRLQILKVLPKYDYEKAVKLSKMVVSTDPISKLQLEAANKILEQD